MSVQMRIRDNLQKIIPIWVVAPIAALLFYGSILLVLLFLPFVLLYGYAVLCPLLWARWGKNGKDVLVVSGNTEHSREWADKITARVASRAVFLDYDQGGAWKRRSLAVQLFDIFGPHPIPEMFMSLCLPAVIVVKRNRKPKTFVFGPRKDCDVLLDQLSAELSR